MLEARLGDILFANNPRSQYLERCELVKTADKLLFSQGAKRKGWKHHGENWRNPESPE